MVFAVRYPSVVPELTSAFSICSKSTNQAYTVCVESDSNSCLFVLTVSSCLYWAPCLRNWLLKHQMMSTRPPKNAWHSLRRRAKNTGKSFVLSNKNHWTDMLYFEGLSSVPKLFVQFQCQRNQARFFCAQSCEEGSSWQCWGHKPQGECSETVWLESLDT